MLLAGVQIASWKALSFVGTHEPLRQSLFAQMTLGIQVAFTQLGMQSLRVKSELELRVFGDSHCEGDGMALIAIFSGLFFYL
ncbi:MAG: hypothetical protein RL145_2205 [Pseudomonadota bacterium]